MQKKFRALLLCVGLACVVVSPVQAQEEASLKSIMRGMLESMERIVEGIMVEDYALISAKAEGIIYHGGQSSAQRLALSRKLGIEVMTFKMFDDSVRRYAKIVKKAALSQDRKAVLSGYAKLVQACTSCHSSYRERIRKSSG